MVSEKQNYKRLGHKLVKHRAITKKVHEKQEEARRAGLEIPKNKRKNAMAVKKHRESAIRYERAQKRYKEGKKV